MGDAICASAEFAEAFRREMLAALPGSRWERIAPDHPLFTQQFGGYDLPRVTLNDPQLRTESEGLEARRVRITPLLEGLTLEERLVVVFSPYDISCALESHSSLDCKRYIREDAARLGINIILFALQQ